MEYDYNGLVLKIHESIAEVKDEVHCYGERLAQFIQKQEDHEREAERLERDIEANKVKIAEIEGRVKTLEEINRNAAAEREKLATLVAESSHNAAAEREKLAKMVAENSRTSDRATFFIKAIPYVMSVGSAILAGAAVYFYGR